METMTGPPIPPVSVPAPRPPMRTFTKVIIVFNVLMALWFLFGMVNAITGAASTCSHPNGSAYLSTTDEQSACETGSAIGIFIGAFAIIMFTALVDAILGVLWMVTRKNQQD